MDIEYDIDIEDMVEFNYYSMSHQPQYKDRLNILRIIYICFAIGFTFIGFTAVMAGDITLSVLMFGIVLFIIIYYWFRFTTKQIRNRVRKSVIKQYPQTPNDEVCRHRLSISKEGLRESTDFGNGFVNWTAFNSVVQTDNYLYFLLRLGKGYVVPRKAFTDDTEFNLFADTVRKYKAGISG